MSQSVKVNSLINSKVKFVQGDITKLAVDAITNAANKELRGGGGVDGAIHRAAGPLLMEECRKLNGCKTGEAKITIGFNLPAKYVIHTVGPIYKWNNPDKSARQLRNCYENSLCKLCESGLRTIAFPCISTGIYGYPNEKAARVALKTVRDWLEVEKEKKNVDLVDNITFCLFLNEDVQIYEMLWPQFFPSNDESMEVDEEVNEPSHKTSDISIENSPHDDSAETTSSKVGCEPTDYENSNRLCTNSSSHTNDALSQGAKTKPLPCETGKDGGNANVEDTSRKDSSNAANVADQKYSNSASTNKSDKPKDKTKQLSNWSE